MSGELTGKLVLVTGGGGFIGSHLAHGLVEAGCRVRVLDNFETGHRENLDGLDVDLHEGDIRDVATCDAACDGAAVVFHQAALGSVPRSMEDPATSLAVNVAGTANMFAAARKAGIARVVYASSSSVYGDNETLPKREGDEGAPMSPYALSKAMDEELAELFARCYAMQFVGLRYFNVYGSRQDPNGPYAAVVPRFFAACRAGESLTIFGDGAQSRDFTHVSDVVRANMMAATADIDGALALNIGAESTTTITELAETIIAVTGADVKPTYLDPRPGDVRFSRADTRRAFETIGWRAEVTLRDGLAAMDISG